ncbi:hypothetical protein [Streptomyces sp. NPDC055749]
MDGVAVHVVGGASGVGAMTGFGRAAVLPSVAVIVSEITIVLD